MPRITHRIHWDPWTDGEVGLATACGARISPGLITTEQPVVRVIDAVTCPGCVTEFVRHWTTDHRGDTHG
jgi:hypothetical protein